MQTVKKLNLLEKMATDKIDSGCLLTKNIENTRCPLTKKLKKLSWKFKESYKAYIENYQLRPFVSLKKSPPYQNYHKICSKPWSFTALLEV